MYLYILSEDDTDDLFYTGCVEQITGKVVTPLFRKLRKGGGVGEVRSKTRILLQQIKYTGNMEDSYFVIAMDNDRSPAHPDHTRLPGLSKKEQKYGCRFCEIERIIMDILGKDKETWPIKGAIAVPVQMLESWLLLICNNELYKKEELLPIFSLKDSPLAQDYYSPKSVPDQLKDLRDKEKDRQKLTTNEELCLHCCTHLVPNKLQDCSPSFSLFKQQVETWDLQKK